MEKTIEEKKKSILASDIPGYKLYPPGNGKAISKMKKGGFVGARIVNKAYENMLHLSSTIDNSQETRFANNQGILPSTIDNRQESLPSTSELMERIATLESVVKAQDARIHELESALSNTRQDILPSRLDNRQKSDSPHVLGFQLVQKKVCDNLYWYACKMIKNKMRWIYIGRDQTGAEQKIQKWLDARKEYKIDMM